MHQNASKNASKCFCTRAQIGVTYTSLPLPFLNFGRGHLAASTVNVQMQDLGESQAKSTQMAARGGRDLADLPTTAEVCVRWRELIGSGFMGTAYQIGPSD